MTTHALVPFFIGCIAISAILTPLSNSSGGSILLPALFHFQLNNPIFPDAQPYYTVLFAFVAIAVIVTCRHKMFNKNGAVTDVAPNSETNPSGELNILSSNFDISKE